MEGNEEDSQMGAQVGSKMGSHGGAAAAIAAAILFGASTPLAKLLLDSASPWMLAALLYLGAGVGLFLYRRAIRAPRVRLSGPDARWFAAAIACGGVIGPVLLMYGISEMPATGASLLQNAEAVFTALLAWLIFKEHVSARIVLGMAVIVAGAALVTVPGRAELGAGWAPLAVLGACLFWAMDNNLTRKVSDTDPSWIAMSKGLVAGCTNLVLALAAGSAIPSPSTSALVMALGFVSYGLSLSFFVLALRKLGTARAGAYFSTAPFIGAAVAIALGDPLTAAVAAGGALMALGVWLHLTEKHEHEHAHESGTGVLWHKHPHFPDTQHRHAHE